MRLLIVTQKVDRSDPILGFFHRWIEEFAWQCERVTVIGQYVAEHDLPANVSVLSLGKEKGASRFAQVRTFFRLIREHRDCATHVLVHMTPIWVVLGCVPWFLMHRRVYLWYEARGTRWPLRIALRCVRKVFSASGSGMPFGTKKSVIVGHGIDTERFRPGDSAFERELLVSVGRITPSKRIPVLFAPLLASRACCLTIAGTPITSADRWYAQQIEDLIRSEGLGGRVTIGPLDQEGLLALLRDAHVFLHASETALDKALLEAMACGVPVVTTSAAARGVVPEECFAADSAFVSRVQAMIALPPERRWELGGRLRRTVQEGHSLPRLVRRLVAEMEA